MAFHCAARFECFFEMKKRRHPSPLFKRLDRYFNFDLSSLIVEFTIPRFTWCRSSSRAETSCCMIEEDTLSDVVDELFPLKTNYALRFDHKTPPIPIFCADIADEFHHCDRTLTVFSLSNQTLSMETRELAALFVCKFRLFVEDIKIDRRR